MRGQDTITPSRGHEAVPPFTVRPDAGCQRGLHLVYEIPSATDTARLERELHATFGDRLVVAEERWGARVVRRIVLQFRFEVRLGTRDDRISFLFRSVSGPETRATDRAAFEAALRSAIAREDVS